MLALLLLLVVGSVQILLVLLLDVAPGEEELHHFLEEAIRDLGMHWRNVD